MAASQSEDIFPGSFQCAPFLNHSHAKPQQCFEDPSAEPYQQHAKHIRQRRPPCALPIITDHEEIKQKQLPAVLDFTLNGKHPNGDVLAFETLQIMA